MTGNDDFRIRPGRIRSTRAAANKTLPGAGAPGRAEGRRSLAGRPAGAAAGLGAAAPRALPRRDSSTTAPAAPWSRRESCGRCVRRARCAPISGISSATGSPAMDRPENCSMRPETRRTAELSPNAAKDDRHHFRFIVSPDDAGELSKLAQLHARTHGPGLARSRHAARLGRHRPLEHRASPYPHPCARPRRRWQRPRH